MSAAAEQKVRAVLCEALLPRHSATTSGYVTRREGDTVLVEFHEAGAAGALMPVVPSLDAFEAAEMVRDADVALRRAGFGVVRRGDVLVVGTDMVAVLAAGLGAS